ncbi:MAG TPA: hypothetical protein PKY13_08380, partial [Microthrixaceae bacterium]|nr:hypothetical protein [Microthrixaceae bacterium]
MPSHSMPSGVVVAGPDHWSDPIAHTPGRPDHQMVDVVTGAADRQPVEEVRVRRERGERRRRGALGFGTSTPSGAGPVIAHGLAPSRRDGRR